MTPHDLRERWARGDVSLGGWLLSADTLIAATVASLGFDYIGIDAQHGAPSVESAPELIAAVGQRSAPLVRLPQNDPADIGRVLDAGALGVIVPLVETADEARAAVAACRYPPAGQRSFGPARARVAYGTDYGARANDLVLCIPMIETARGVRNVEEIVSVSGVDAIYVGPADLSLSLGLAPLLDQEDPAFTDALTTVAAAARRHGVVAGVHASAGLAHKRHEQGFTMITVGVDQTLLVEAMTHALGTGRAATDGGTAP